MKLTEIQSDLNEAGKFITDRQVYKIMRRLGIKHVGARQNPQQYPANAAARILKHFGIKRTK
ncbi:MAG: hypothetical protein KGL39_40995 [Patescibacteria group bacterium]|nr:hypothetical protein [Patescibacteria group bacterium]